MGAANWPGAAADLTTGMLYVPSNTSTSLLTLRKSSAEEGPYEYIGRVRPFLDSPRDLPLVKPPYSRITAIDLNTGEHAWMQVVGEGPVNHPDLKPLELGEIGWSGRSQWVTLTANLLLGVSPQPWAVISTSIHNRMSWRTTPSTARSWDALPCPVRALTTPSPSAPVGAGRSWCPCVMPSLSPWRFFELKSHCPSRYSTTPMPTMHSSIQRWRRWITATSITCSRWSMQTGRCPRLVAIWMSRTPMLGFVARHCCATSPVIPSARDCPPTSCSWRPC